VRPPIRDEEDRKQKDNEKESRAQPAPVLCDHAGWAGPCAKPGDALPDRIQEVGL